MIEETIIKNEVDKELCRLYYVYKQALLNLDSKVKEERFYITCKAFEAVKNGDKDLFYKLVEHFQLIKATISKEAEIAREEYNTFLKNNCNNLAYCASWTEITPYHIQNKVKGYTLFSSIY